MKTEIALASKILLKVERESKMIKKRKTASIFNNYRTINHHG